MLIILNYMKSRATYAYFSLSYIKIRAAYACDAPILLKAKAIKIGANWYWIYNRD